MDSLIARAEFIDAVSERIGFRPPEFVAEFSQPADPRGALELNLLGQLVEPSEEGKRAVVVTLKINLGAGQPSTLPCSHY